MTEWKWNGARWWKFDFHAHTPASSGDYGKEQDQPQHRKCTPKEWLLDYMVAGIDCVAITDHNTGMWIDQLKEALEELENEKPETFRELHLFPGMEISVHGGIHVLAILAPSKTASDLQALCGAVGYEGTPGESNGVTRRSFVEVVDAVVSAGGIAIPAHVDEEKGLFQQQGATLQQALGCDQVFAMEMVDPTFQKPQPYIDKKPPWTEVLGSDAHRSAGQTGQRYPGSHFTWVKMGSPGLEGLRLALLDGPLSVCRSDQETGYPNQHAPLVLESVEVSQARYMGRATSFTLGWNPWLNAVVGGRGTGKSTIVEFMRLALRRVDELPEDLRPEFDKYGRAYPDREDSGLLTDETAIRVIYRKNGSKFRVQWSTTGDLDPIEEEAKGGWSHAEGDIRQRFPVRIYSQKQIFQLAKTPLALLGVVDEAPEVNRQSWNERWKEEETRFLTLCAKAREIEAGLAEESRLRGELDDIKRKMAIFEEAGHSDVLKVFQRRSRQQRAVEAWEESCTDTGERLREVAAGMVPDVLDETSFDLDSEEDAQLHKSASAALGRLDDIRKTLEGLGAQADQVLSEWRRIRDASLWKRAVDSAAQAYEELRERLAEEAAGDPAAYGELVQRRQAIEQRLKELGDRKKQVDDLQKQAAISSARLLHIRRELTESRRIFLDDVLKDNRYVRIQVVPYGARDTVETEFRQLLQKEGREFERDIGSPDRGGLLGEVYGDDSGSKEIEQTLAKIKQWIRKIAAGLHDPASLSDQRFATHISRLQPEGLDRLDCWFPEDSLDVQYSTTGDGERFRSIQEGSPGQKTAALLAFLLSYGEEPLILDQPEDDLDNHLIYDLIVTQLREIEKHRQVIVVTHNANIVVNGDAELVVALVARGGETQKECEGSLQERLVRNTICNVMEGGREAFEQRYRRIALEGRLV